MIVRYGRYMLDWVSLFYLHCIVYFIIHTHARRTHLFIYTLTAIQHFILFYTVFRDGDCPKNAVDSVVEDG